MLNGPQLSAIQKEQGLPVTKGVIETTLLDVCSSWLNSTKEKLNYMVMPWLLFEKSCLQKKEVCLKEGGYCVNFGICVTG